MAAIDFPTSPTNGQVFTSSDKTWEYSASLGVWNLVTQTATGATGPTGPTGPAGSIISLTGTANQIAVSASTGAVTVSIPTSPEFTGTPTAPTAAADTNTTQLATTAYVNRIARSGFRNVIINGGLDIWQRGTASPITPASGWGYGPDRWRTFSYGSSTTAISRGSFTIGNPITGYEPANYVRVMSMQTATLLSQPIENVRTAAGQTVTVSFWAKVAGGTPNMLVELNQNFGGGGSTTVSTVVTNATLSTSWTRYTATVTLPSISGKTIGTNDFLELIFTSTTIATVFDFWGMQVEFGPQATPFEQRPVGTELALCQRYYETSEGMTAVVGGSTGFGGNTYFNSVEFKVTKRIAPTLYIYDAYSPYAVNTMTVWQSASGQVQPAQNEGITTSGFHPTSKGYSRTDCGMGRFTWKVECEL